MSNQHKVFPIPKKISINESKVNKFDNLIINFNDFVGYSESQIDKMKKIIKLKMRNFKDLKIYYNENKEIFEKENAIFVNISNKLTCEAVDELDRNLFSGQGYILDLKDKKLNIYFENNPGIIHAFSTLKQLVKKSEDGHYFIPDLYILDYPEIEKRSLSVTFAWYAGYGRVGFDMQLWDFSNWKEFINLCSDFKVNQLNMCMYGYWPFKFDEYPETILKDFEMKIWNKESKNWIETKYTHPNIVSEFLPDLIKYAHDLSIDIYAYIGLNSYNGGYSNIYKDKRMKLPENSKFINDFDTLCLSNEETIEYLKKSIERIVSLGFDGVIFEESEEAFWFCNCEKCKKEFLDKTSSPAEAKHLANYKFLRVLCEVIRKQNPECKVGLRAWREPPLEKDIEYLKKCEASIPKDVRLYWAPGLYVGEDEFEKWVEVFGKERICARDCESSGVSATMGRLLRLFRSNVLRSEEEANHQYIENDIVQHKGSAKLGCKGINGYLFEFYEFFLTFFVHVNYGWDSKLEENKFYRYALDSVFGEEISDDILYVLKNILTIHESQISIFTSSVFPFLRNKVNKEDMNVIRKAREDWEIISGKIRKIKKYIENDENLEIYCKHFDKLENTNNRNFYIYGLCLSSIKYDNAKTEEEKIKYLKEMDYYNEKDFGLIKKMYFDVNPVDATGVKACMYPYHEIKREINNILNSKNKDNKQIYLGVEALGWLWL